MAGKQAGRGRVAPAGDEGRLVVDPRWLLRAGLLILLVAFVCGYATFCLLFYQGQWQLVLHPVRTTERPGTIGGRPYEVLRFGPDGTGLPRRTAWWMKAGAAGRYRQLVLLYLPGGDGSLKDARTTLDALRGVGAGVFAMNYRGYGESAAAHPSEAAMREDAEAAWRYLVEEEHVPEADVIPYGAGLGGALALRLAAEHHGTAAVVLDGPRFDVVERVKKDPRVRLWPVGLLLRERFALEPELGTLKVPKLILTRGGTEDGHVKQAADPKMTVEAKNLGGEELIALMRRFLDVYAPPTTEPRLILQPESGRGR